MSNRTGQWSVEMGLSVVGGGGGGDHENSLNSRVDFQADWEAW